MARKKILIVSYYWYPFADVGTYRISRFAKYLAKSGWDIVVLTSKKAAAGMKGEPDDPVLENIKVYRANIIEPVSLLKGKKGGSAKTSNPSIFYQKDAGFISRLAVWARLNIMIPDAKFTWKWFAVPLGKKVIEQEKPDVILSTSPPPTTSLIARKLAAWSGLPWHADFRDPWTNIYYYDDNPPSAWARKRNKKLEASVLEKADRLTVVNHGFFPSYHLEDKLTKIPNGFDPDHVLNKKEVPQTNDSVFYIRYFGSMKINQYPEAFIKALHTLSVDYPEIAENIHFDFYGNIDPNIKDDIKSASHIIKTSFTGYIPHDEMMKKVNSSDLLLLLIGRTKNSKFGLSTKVFEYMTSGKPVMGIGPVDGAASELVTNTNIGKFFSHEDEKGVASFIKETYHAKQKEETLFNPSQKAIQQYDFSYLTKRLEKILVDLIS
ncbi:MAG: glycosyltransferase [Gracilimonas sp.]|uniref:glycosyltransferase n=1 Tax=Gracilimonas TaxID=649462 RepID=UPI001B08DF6B|nr:glycosyltransferase [Gracilimonas sp.]MBO6584532.1 glycosyltransferase [Gracilimonas sp.]MBO6616197.1 glycosyltransferase [Gracilimonas sp.]